MTLIINPHSQPAKNQSNQTQAAPAQPHETVLSSAERRLTDQKISDHVALSGKKTAPPFKTEAAAHKQPLNATSADMLLQKTLNKILTEAPRATASQANQSPNAVLDLLSDE